MSENQMEELELVGRLFHFGIGFIFRIEGIIRVIVVDRPNLFRDVRVANDAKEQVIEWLHNPHRCDKEERTRIQEPIDQIAKNMLELIIQSGNVPNDLFSAYLRKHSALVTATEKWRTRSKKRRGQGGGYHD